MSGGRVLVVQLARLGDLVQTWPLLRRLTFQAGGVPPDLVADRNLKKLHPLGPRLEQVWDLNLSGLARLAATNLAAAYDEGTNILHEMRAHGYEVVYNLNFSRLSLLLAYLLCSEVRGYRPVEGGREFLRDPWLALVYALVHVRRFNRLHLSDVFRHLAPAAGPDIPPSASVHHNGEFTLALQLATRHPRRTWPPESFARLTARLLERLGGWVWLLGTKGEASLGARLLQELTPAHRERVINLQGRTDLQELADRLREARLLVSGDTGTLHLAAALGTPTVGVFMGPASCHETGPYGVGHYVFQAEPACHPCTEAQEACSRPFCGALIPPEAVAEAVIDLVLRDKITTPPLLPPEVRLYRSAWDGLGVWYEPLHSPARFDDLVGQAYRRAAAHLLGVTVGDYPLWLGNCPAEEGRLLETMAAGLRGGMPGGADSAETRAALLPLGAFRRELERQQSLGRQPDEAAIFLERVEQGLEAALQEMCSSAAGYQAGAWDQESGAEGPADRWQEATAPYHPSP